VRATTREEAHRKKPLLRGVLHQVAFFLSLAVGGLLVAEASGTLGRAAAATFAGAAAWMFGASALYHRVQWGASTRRWMRRLDHSGVYLMIAGSYTPYGLLVLDGAWRVAVLSVVWGGVAAAIALRFLWVDAPGWLAATLAIAIGWVGVVALPKVVESVAPAGIALLVAGGVVYTAGGVVYARRRPDPAPAVFGFHELFHSLVIVAVACQYAAIAFFVVPTA
jgi:hemolysin III